MTVFGYLIYIDYNENINNLPWKSKELAMRKKILIISLICTLLLLSACSFTKDKSPSNSKSSDASDSSNESIVRLVDANAEIENLYANRCLNCHAIDLSGKMGEVTNLQKVHERLSYDEIVTVITEGRNLMPSFAERLTEEEINALAGWLSKQ